MSSKRRIRRKACTGKIRHETQQEAAGHRSHLIRSKGYQGLLNTYHCKFCGGWHVGHGGRH